MIAWAFDQLPVNLPPGRRYVTWNLEPRGKVPYIPRCCSRRASVTDPATWDTFDQARGSVEDGKADGLGLVLLGDVVVVDLDDSLGAAGELAADAAALMRALPTYTERSPSDRGLHLLLFGTLPPGRRRRAGLEIYDTSRFITLTGAHVPDSPPAIVDQSAALTALYPRLFPTATRPVLTPPTPRATHTDTELVEKAHNARNGAAFARLWAGDTTGYPSPSEADLELCRQLAFWTGRDHVRMDALFRQSGLYRPKWDGARDQDTYGGRTIAHAIATTPAVYRSRTNRLEELEVPMS